MYTRRWRRPATQPPSGARGPTNAVDRVEADHRARREAEVREARADRGARLGRLAVRRPGKGARRAARVDGAAAEVRGLLAGWRWRGVGPEVSGSSCGFGRAAALQTRRRRVQRSSGARARPGTWRPRSRGCRRACGRGRRGRGRSRRGGRGRARSCGCGCACVWVRGRRARRRRGGKGERRAPADEPGRVVGLERLGEDDGVAVAEALGRRRARRGRGRGGQRRRRDIGARGREVAREHADPSRAGPVHRVVRVARAPGTPRA